MGDIGSIHAFVKRWEKDGRVGMMQDLEARIEGIIFCDGEGAALEGVGMGVGRLEAPAPADDPAELFHSSLLLSRHALTQLLLPTLLKSATTSPVRIISSTSPFYAARALDLTDLDYSSRPFPRWEPWLAEGHASLGSIALLRELQVRVDESRKSESGGLVVMSVCPGFTRAWFRRMLRAESTHPKFSWWGLLAYIVLFPLIWVFGKSAEEASQGMLGAVLGSVRGWDGPVVLEEEGQEEKVGLEEKINKERERESKRLRGGAVYREGREVRCVTSPGCSWATLILEPAQDQVTRRRRTESRCRALDDREQAGGEARRASSGSGRQSAEGEGGEAQAGQGGWKGGDCGSGGSGGELEDEGRLDGHFRGAARTLGHTAPSLVSALALALAGTSSALTESKLTFLLKHHSLLTPSPKPPSTPSASTPSTSHYSTPSPPQPLHPPSPTPPTRT